MRTDPVTLQTADVFLVLLKNFSSLCDFRVIFSAKEGEFVYLVRGGEGGLFVKAKEDNMSRKEKL